MKFKKIVRIMGCMTFLFVFPAVIFLCIAQDSSEIDWDKAKKLFNKQKQGQELTAEEAKYLEQAMELWKKEKKANGKSAEKEKPAPTFKDVKYGPYERNVLDFWQAKSAAPTPVVVFIHGGGFRAGDKDKFDVRILESLLKSGVSFAAINYRFITTDPLPAALHDSARAIQFMRSKAKEWSIDKTRVAAFGGSAGGWTSMWLAMHNDLADSKSSDPVLRESSRLCCAGGTGAQTTLDPDALLKLFGNDTSVLEKSPIINIFGAKTLEDFNTPQMRKVIDECSAIKHLDAGDPPVFLEYRVKNEKVVFNKEDEKKFSEDLSAAVHHPGFGIMLKEAMDKLGIECVLRMPGEEKKDNYADMTDFFLKKFGIKK